ncbi:Ribonuclease H superfamily [Sesbania bispinosa]|nr:Ribonuclease H superfamily [Sesbania bispinosa]
MEGQSSTHRVTPRRLSFSLEDFQQPNNNDDVTPTTNEGNPLHTPPNQPELNLIGNFRTGAGTMGEIGGGDMQLTISASLLNSIMTSQQNLANLVSDLSARVTTGKEADRQRRPEDTMESGDDALVTQKKLRQLLQNKHDLQNAVFDLEPPLTNAIMTTPYPNGYQPPTFRKFDGTSSTKEHLMCFLDDLEIHRNNKDLRLKEFSKSLAGRAFTWYAKLRPCSINTWEELVTEFYGKFLEEEEDGSQIFLSLSGISTFAELMRRAADVTDALKRQGKRSKEAEGMFDICVAEGREKKKVFRSGRTSGGTSTYNTNEVPPVPLARSQICQLVEEWLKDGTLRPMMDKPPLTKEQYDDQAYCILHRANSHTMMECWTIRRAFHKQVKMGRVLLPEAEQESNLHKRPLPNHSVNMITSSVGRVRIEEIAEDTDTEEGVLSVGLSKTRGFRVLFGQLGLEHDAQKEAAKAVIHIVKKMGRGPGRTTIEGVKVRRALVDNESGAVETLGRVHAVLEVGPIKTTNIFQIVEGDSSYHLLLGRPWIHLHQCVPSTLHQCIKSNFKGRDIEIPGVRAPFEANEAHFIDASLFDEVAPPGSSAIETRMEDPLQERGEFIRKNSVYHPTQAFKRPKTGTTAGIEKEYLPNGEDSPDQDEECLEEIDIGEDEEQKRPLFISSYLDKGERESLIRLLKEFRDVFAWRYEEMPRLSTDLVTHNLALRPDAKPVKQGARKFAPEIECENHPADGTPQQMEPPKSLKDMQQLMGKIGYIRCFIPTLSELIEPMRELLKGKGAFAWGQKHQEAFEKIKTVVASTQVMSPPIPNEPMRLYLAITKKTINGLIAQDVEGEEKPIAYLSRVMKDAESRYSTQEKHCLGEYDIKIIYPQKHNCQALVDMMAICAGRHEDEVSEDMKGEMHEANVCEAREEEWWCIKFDGTPSETSGGAGITITKQGKEVSKEEGETGRTMVTFKRLEEPALSTLEPEGATVDWRSPILLQLSQKITSKATREYQNLRGRLYKRSAEGLLVKCVTEEEGEKKNKRSAPSSVQTRDAPKDWAEYLPLALWAYRTTKHGGTKAAPFSLVYGAEATLPVEVLVPSARMSLGKEEERSDVAEIMEEERDKAENELLKHHRRLTLSYEKMVRPSMFCEGEMVLKATEAVMRKQHASKWAPNWEGPYIIQEAYSNGYCTLIDPEDQRVIGPINFKYVKSIMFKTVE